MQNFLDMAENFSVLDPKVGTIYSEFPLFNAHVVFFLLCKTQTTAANPSPTFTGSQSAAADWKC